MRQSQLFTKTLKLPPKDEISINSKLLIQAGYVAKLMAGVYSYLPLGFLVIKRIEDIIRKRMLEISGQEILMPTLTPKEIWQQSGRWENFTDLYKFKDQSGKELALAATHEEVIVPLAKKYINSYKDLPFYAFQIQNKFRAELRSKSGLIRGREFLMKDLYSFHRDEKDLDDYYQKCIIAYQKIFKDAGIDKNTVITLASGGTFSKHSHEFQTIADAGEDLIYLCEKCNLAINKEIFAEQKSCSSCGSKKLILKKGIEVGNIFKLMDKYSRPFDLTYQDEDGKKKIILMGCYGIGLGRLLATIVEINHDQEGIVWPKTVTPFKIHLIDLGNKKISDKYYQKFIDEDFSVLYDDRDISGGIKLKDADLIGITVRLISSPKNGENLEIKYRHEKNLKVQDFPKTFNELKHFYFNV